MANKITLIDMHCHLNYLPGLLKLRQKFFGPKLDLERLLTECEKRGERLVLGLALYSLRSLFSGNGIHELIEEVKKDIQKKGQGKIKLLKNKADLDKDFVIGIFIQVESAKQLDCHNRDLEKLKESGVLGIIPVLKLDNPYGKRCQDLRKTIASNEQEGLSQEGYYFLERIHQLGLWVDLTHMTDRVAKEAGQFFAGKILCSTTGPRSVINCHRNICELTENTIKLKNGVIGLSPAKRSIGHCDQSMKRVLNYYYERGLMKQLCFGTDFGQAFSSIKKINCLFSLKDYLRHELQELPNPDQLAHQICSQNAHEWLAKALP